MNPHNPSCPTPTGFEADDERYFDLAHLARYSGLSVATLQRYIADASHPLPAHHVAPLGQRGKVLVSKRAFDAWIQSFPPPRARGRQSAAGAADPERVARAVRSMRGW